MERREQENPIRRKEGGETFTAFFFVGVALFAVACLIVGNSLTPRDTLLRFVPADAVAYVHANGAEAARLLAANAAYDVHPSEAATYAVSRDGALEWTTVSSDDTLAPMRGASLADDATVRGALSAMRSSSALQAYVLPSALPGMEAFDAAIDERAIVIGANTRADGFNATMLPSTDAARMRALGMKTSVSGQRSETARSATDASFSIFGSATDISPFDILFPEKGGEHAFNHGMEVAEAELRRHFERSSSALSIGADIADGVLLHLPGIDPHETMNLIETYVAAAWPARKPFTLPDDQQSYEILVDPEHDRFKPNQDGFSLLAIFDGPHIAVRDDGQGGTEILAGIDLIPEKTVFSTENDRSCQTLKGASYIRMADGEQFLREIPFGEVISRYFGAHSLLIQESGDNLVLFCGYDPQYGDKIWKNQTK